MNPKRIILVRHGESESNVDSKLFGWKPDHAHDLTDKGHEDAHLAGRNIAGILNGETFGVFVSPYVRTLQTKDDILSELKPAVPAFVLQDPRLREQDYGAFPTEDESRLYREIRKKYGRFFYRFPGGESCADVYDRLSDFMGTLHRRFQREDCPENIIIVFHGTAMKCFLFRWYHWDVQKFEEMRSYPHACHIVLMTKQDGTSEYTVCEPFVQYFLG